MKTSPSTSARRGREGGVTTKSGAGGPARRPPRLNHLYIYMSPHPELFRPGLAGLSSALPHSRGAGPDSFFWGGRSIIPNERFWGAFGQKPNGIKPKKTYQIHTGVQNVMDRERERESEIVLQII